MKLTITLSEVLEKEIRKQYKNIKEFAEKNNLPYMTVTSVIKRGAEKTTIGTLEKICSALNMSVPELYEQQKIQSVKIKATKLSKEEYTDDELLSDLKECYFIDRDRVFTKEEIADIRKTMSHF